MAIPDWNEWNAIFQHDFFYRNQRKFYGTRCPGHRCEPKQSNAYENPWNESSGNRQRTHLIVSVADALHSSHRMSRQMVTAVATSSKLVFCATKNDFSCAPLLLSTQLITSYRSVAAHFNCVQSHTEFNFIDAVSRRPHTLHLMVVWVGRFINLLFALCISTWRKPRNIS